MTAGNSAETRRQSALFNLLFLRWSR